VHWQFIDPRDNASAVALALKHSDIGYEVFTVAEKRTDVGELIQS
jgi:hypothetical protein